MHSVTNMKALAELEAAEQEVPATILKSPWPVLASEALHGLAGEYVRALDPHTEADPVAVLVQFLAFFGNIIGRGSYSVVEADRHCFNLYVVLVGESSKGRKGVSRNQALRPFHAIDGEWAEQRLQDGLSSGEGLIWAVRDPIQRSDKTRGRNEQPKYETVTVDPGVTDKRLVITEAEFASPLRILAREGNTLSAILRRAWDSGGLNSLTKNSPAKATGAHISVIGHVTRQELLRYLTSTEAGNGFGNRILWCCVRRSKLLPEGGRAHTVDFGPLSRVLGEAVRFAKNAGELKRDPKAAEIWERVYADLSEGKPGLLGSMIARSEAQVLRLSGLYALLDRSKVVRPEHLLAALALWDYCETSALYIFGEALGDPMADEILRALRQTPAGLTRTEIRDLFGRNRRSDEIGRALSTLLDGGLATFTKEGTMGRSAEVWQARRAGGGECGSRRARGGDLSS